MALSYKVYRGGVVIATPTASPYIDTGLTNGTPYAYQISAVNDTGEGPKSSTVTATPSAPVGGPIGNLQAALNALPSGGILDAAGQSFSLSSQITMPAHVELRNVSSCTWTGGGGALQSGFFNMNSGSVIRNVNIIGGPYSSVRIWVGVNAAQIINCDISNSPKLGIIGWQMSNLLISGGRVHGHNAGGGGEGNEAGGIKLGDSTNFLITGVESDHNKGPGILADVACSGHHVTLSKVHDNTYAGLMDEISAGPSTWDFNSVWECGWGDGRASFAGGILYSSTTGANINNNVVAWCPTGIIGISQAGRNSNVAGTKVVNNKVKVSAGHNEESNFAEGGAPNNWGPFSPNTTASAGDLSAAGIPASPLPGH